VRANWSDFEAKHRIESIQPETEPGRTVAPGPAIAATRQDWTEISANNLFSFDRTDIGMVAAKETRPAEPKPVLFGSMSIGNEKIAMLAPAQSGGSRASRPVKVGENVDSWQVVQIDDKSVVVAANGVRQTILMNDPTAQVPRSMDRTGGIATAPSVNVVNPSPAPPPAATSNSSQPTMTAQPSPAEQSTDEYLITPFGKVRRTRP
jgi:hypothetical protein